MTKLDDIHLILLSHASQKDEGSLLPAPKTLKVDKPKLESALRHLLEQGLAEEVSGVKVAEGWRQDESGRFGLKLTAAGLALLDKGGADDDGAEDEAPTGEKAPRSGSKRELVLGLLRRPDGATLDELVDATGWLPHTTRAALTGLRKRGHAITNQRRDGISRYSLAEAA